MKIVLLGDLGSAEGYHVGDEAMAEAVVEQIAERTDVTVVAISGDADDTAHRYGWRAVPRIGFGAPLTSDAERDTRLDAVLRAAGGEANAIAWSDPAWGVIHAVAEADGVVISGGGNLSSTWPEHIYERAAVARLAEVFSTRHLVTGQTLGPHLTGRHGELVARTLVTAQLVGVRDEPSLDIGRRLGVPAGRLVRVADDAAYLQPSDVAPAVPSEPYVVATFAPDSGLLDHEDYVASVAALLDDLVDSAGLRVVLVAHHAATKDGEMSGDLAVHREIAGAMRSSAVEVLPILTAREVIAITHGATLVLSTRYHPVVFALSAAVPVVGIAVDAYTSQKIRGAMSAYGMADYAVSVASLRGGAVQAVVADLLDRRESVRAHLAHAGTTRRGESDRWWDGVVASLGGAEVEVADLGAIAGFEGGSWVEMSRALSSWSDAVSLRQGADRLASAAREEEVAARDARIRMLEREVADLSADLAGSRAEIEAQQEALEAAHKLVSAKLGPGSRRVGAGSARSGPSFDRVARRAVRRAVHSARTSRYAHRLRRLYREIASGPRD